MTSLCVDIGLRNLSLCIMNPRFEIELWEVYNVFENDNHLCPARLKNGKTCDKKCTMRYAAATEEIIYTCKVHFPKEIRITNHNKYHCKNINEYALQEIADLFLMKIQKIIEDDRNLFENIESIYIELQSPLNKKALFISHILYGKFIDLYRDRTGFIIRFVRAAQKLKVYTGPEIPCDLKNEYVRRKWLGIQHMKWFLHHHLPNGQKEKWLTHLSKHPKQDDLCDSGLMAINAIMIVNKKKKLLAPRDNPTDQSFPCIPRNE